LATPEEAQLPVYKKFLDHTVEHFAQEERWMLATGFSADNCHAEHHATILETMRVVEAHYLDSDKTIITRMAEALAEWTHARIRRELGFGASEPAELRDVLAQRYRGSRYSFGYPACPNVADSRQQLAWLGADRIGLRMDESDQLEPEQSTTALVALHSQARYFSA
jgi:cobalamin-dependent methionine synthase I